MLEAGRASKQTAACARVVGPGCNLTRIELNDAIDLPVIPPSCHFAAVPTGGGWGTEAGCFAARGCLLGVVVALSPPPCPGVVARRKPKERAAHSGCPGAPPPANVQPASPDRIATTHEPAIRTRAALEASQPARVSLDHGIVRFQFFLTFRQARHSRFNILFELWVGRRTPSGPTSGPVPGSPSRDSSITPNKICLTKLRQQERDSSGSGQCEGSFRRRRVTPLLAKLSCLQHSWTQNSNARSTSKFEIAANIPSPSCLSTPNTRLHV